MKKISLFTFVSVSFYANAQNPLAIPDTLSGTSLVLNIKDSTRQFYTGYYTNTYGINADYLGPTLFLNRGDSVSMMINNLLNDTTTIHWHGMHVSPANDGGPHTFILPNSAWNPKFKVRDKAATYWYHPHLHMKTNLHATLGAAGLIIVRDSEEAAINLPRKYGVDDFPVVIQSKAFDSGKQITVGNAYDSVMMVNGTLRPYLQVPAQVVRLRLLNASSNRVFNIGFTGNLTFYMIASDGGLLSAPVSLTRLKLAPGERAELLLNLTGMQSQVVNMMSYASEFPNGIYGASNPSTMAGTITGYSSNILNGNNFQVLELDVVAQTINPVTSIPATLANVQPLNPASANANRQITFAPVVMGPNTMLNGPFRFNGTSFNMNTINYTIPQNNVEVWTLNNQTSIAHPFHIHGVQFYIIEINGSAPPPELQGRKDMLLVPSMQTAKFITVFDDFCDSVVPYMYHCHMLPHEDEGMMGQYRVSCQATGIEEQSNGSNTLIYPNPGPGKFFIENADGELSVYNLLGEKIIAPQKISDQKTTIDLSNEPAGIYFLRIISARGSVTQKIVLR